VFGKLWSLRETCVANFQKTGSAALHDAMERGLDQLGGEAAQIKDRWPLWALPQQPIGRGSSSGGVDGVADEPRTTDDAGSAAELTHHDRKVARCEG
jgi:hypothetical protein